MIRSLWALLCRVVLLAAVGVVVASVTAICVQIPWLLAVLVVLAAWRNVGRWKGGWSHGTARMASVTDLDRGGMLGDRGLILGRTGWAEVPGRLAALWSLVSLRVRSDLAVGLFLAAFWSSRAAAGRMIRVTDYVHLASFSRTGGGKGVSVVIPTLLSHNGTVVVMDPKGENFELTAEHRRKRFHHRIVRLDPMQLGGPGAASFNPMAFIDPTSDQFLDECRDLANMLVVRKGTETDPFWNDSAELVLTAAIAFTIACEKNPANIHLGVVRHIVSSPDNFSEAIQVMQQMDSKVVRRLGGQCAFLVEKVLSSVMATVQQHTSWMDSEAVSACLKSNDFDPRSLRGGRVSLYLMLPPHQLASLSGLMRCWLGSIIRILSREGASEKQQILFLLDEIGQLGPMRALEDATTIMRGYGIRLWYIFQSLQQVQVCYGEKAAVILDNIATQQYFAISSYETAKAISERIGDGTIRLNNANANTSTSRQSGSGPSPQSISHSSSSGFNTAELARRVWKTEEILCAPETLAFVFHRNNRPAVVELLRFYDAPEFRKAGNCRGTGKRRGLGLVAGILAMLTLCGSIAFATVVKALSLPMMHMRFSTPRAYTPAGYSGDLWMPGGEAPPPSIFPELVPYRYRRNEPSIFPELDPVYYNPGR